MRILIAVVLILVVLVVLFFQGGSMYILKDQKIDKNDLPFILFSTVVTIGVVVMMGYLFVLYAKAF